MQLEIKDLGVVIAAVITGILSNILTNIYTQRRTISEIKLKNYMQQLENVYLPIMQVIEDWVIPGDGYEGISEYQFNQIDKITRDNAHLVDEELYGLVWRLKEDVRWADRNAVFDLDRKLLDSVVYRYNLLRKKLYLPYDRKRFLIYRMISKMSWGIYRLFRKWDHYRNKRKRKKRQVNQI